MLEVYANRTVVQHTTNETIVTFGVQLPPVGTDGGATNALARIVMPWSVAKELVAALADGLSYAERTFAEEAKP